MVFDKSENEQQILVISMYSPVANVLYHDCVRDAQRDDDAMPGSSPPRRRPCAAAVLDGRWQQESRRIAGEQTPIEIESPFPNSKPSICNPWVPNRGASMAYRLGRFF